MKVKLQPPSATDLPGFNPILPPSAITQVMLLANPNKVSGTSVHQIVRTCQTAFIFATNYDHQTQFGMFKQKMNMDENCIKKKLDYW